MQIPAKRRRLRGGVPKRIVLPGTFGPGRDRWRAAFAAVDVLKRLLGHPVWLRGFRVFRAPATGEVEVEVQAVAGGPVTRVPARLQGVAVRTRWIGPGGEVVVELGA